ncbi:MAG: DUF5915 domain-containing protein, partial [Methanoregula sp.]|nr:DUF5915 domain-containing protein [Methanoregula sp.]
APVMKALGPAFGKNSPKVKALIEAADGTLLKAEIEAGRTVTLTDASGSYEVGAQHVTFAEKMPENVFYAPMQDATVYVDVRLTPELEAEGYAREVIRRIQEMRRQLDLAVEDFITVEIVINDDRLYTLLNKEKIGLMTVTEFVADEVRAKTPKGILLAFLKPGEQIQNQELIKDWDVESVQIAIGISRAPD